jgi:hypothetical protein
VAVIVMEKCRKARMLMELTYKLLEDTNGLAIFACFFGGVYNGGFLFAVYFTPLF